MRNPLDGIYANINSDVVEVYLLTAKHIRNLLISEKKVTTPYVQLYSSLIDSDRYRYGQEEALADAHETV